MFEWAFVLVSGGILLTILALALYVLPTSRDSVEFVEFARTAFLFSGVLIALIGVGLGIRAATTKAENTTAFSVGEFLKAHFDDGYTFIRNVNRRKLGYIDAVLVGPPGVLAFRTLDSEGKFLNEKSKWMRADKSGNWRPLMMRNPTEEVVEDIKALRRFCAEHGIADVPVFGVIVFIHDDPLARLIVKDPVVPATHLTSLLKRLQNNYLSKDRIDDKTAIQIVKLLKDD